MGMRNITLILKLEPQDELRKLERDEWMGEWGLVWNEVPLYTASSPLISALWFSNFVKDKINSHSQ